MLEIIKGIVKRVKFIYLPLLWLRELPSRDVLNVRARVINYSWGDAIIRKHVVGTNNIIKIGKGCSLLDTEIGIVGDNNIVKIADNCSLGPNCSLWCEGDSNLIVIGRGVTFTNRCHVCAQEHHTRIIIGDDCMLSNNIIIRTSDSHPIYDICSGKRCNPAKDVVIGKHVWVAPNTKIMKGAIIGENSVIGSNSVVTKEIEPNTLAVGAPACTVKKDVTWTREKLF